MDRLILKREWKIDLWDWILVLGFALSPMTQLRVWKVGPGEVLCLVWSLRYLNIKKIIFSGILKFFVLFIISLSIGTVIGLYATPEETKPTSLLTWLYLGYISCMIYVGFYKKDTEYTERVLFVGAAVAALWFLFLYIYSRVISSSLFGIELWYHGRRFSGGALNPHQVSLLLCGIAIYFLRNVMVKRHMLFSIIMAAVSLVMEIATESSSGLAALAASFLVGVYVFTANLGTSRKLKAGIMVIETLIIALLVVVLFGQIIEFIYNWISSDKNGLGRLSLFSHITESFNISPIFGTGPGTHSESSSGYDMEFHNTYLEILAAGGIVAVLILIWFTIRIIRNATSDSYFIPLIATLYAYGMGGFSMRRLPYWWLLTFVFVITERKYREHVMAKIEDEQLDEENV
ncbi:MAG: hypothetical protein CW338_08640 [Clostridiales bacterium]|nr:hypothetical protein [Clostridiales bacterium]